MAESRLFRIIYYLMDKGHATTAELAERFEVSTRTILRDIDALSGAGVPVYTEPGRNGGVRLVEGYVLQKAALSVEERREVLLALGSLSSWRRWRRPLKSWRLSLKWSRKAGLRLTFQAGAQIGATVNFSRSCGVLSRGKKG